MGMKAWAVTVVAILGFAGMAEAGGFAPVGATIRAVPAPVIAPEPTPLEWLRYEGPRMGRDVLVRAANGVTVPGIEWRHGNEVRVRTESGAPLTLAERASIRQQALTCRRGEVRDVSERVEFNGTFVVEYDCAWLQGAQ